MSIRGQGQQIGTAVNSLVLGGMLPVRDGAGMRVMVVDIRFQGMCMVVRHVGGHMAERPPCQQESRRENGPEESRKNGTAMHRG